MENELAENADTIDGLRQELCRCRESLLQVENAQAETQQALDDMSERRNSLDSSVMTLTSQLLEVAKERDDLKSALVEFNKSLDEVENMKQGYEERISKLRSRIVELKALQAQAERMRHSEEPSAAPRPVIDMTDASPYPGEDDPNDDNWLRPLGPM